MNNSMVAHLWANEKQESAHGSNFYFEGESIYSYGRHFEVGRIVRNKRGEKAYLINDTYYSSTTSKHQYYVREAIPTGSKVFYVECNMSYCIGNMLFVTNMLESIKDAIEKYKKARTELSYRDIWETFTMYALCEKSMCSEMPAEALDFPPIFDDDDKVLDGIDISSDYAGKVFRLLPSAEMNRDSVLKNISNFDLYVNNIRRSYGEKVVLSLESLFNLMFGQKDYTFPIQDLVEYKKKSNAFWIKRIDNLLKYYERNRITLTESSFEYTVLMDEPDRNLDIDNVMQIYNVLSFHKPQTQIIAIVHNPALIYKLSKLDCVNFIEMTEGYLNKISIFASN